MANRYPYISSGGPLTQAVSQLRKSFPSVVDAELLKKLGLAPNNESYLINILRFLGLIDKESKKIAEKAKAFVLHDQVAFESEFANLVQAAYSDLFDIRGEEAWTIDRNALITFFRQSDESTDIVGQRQATTFATLASLSGKRPVVAGQPKVQRSAGDGKPKRQERRTTKSSPHQNTISPSVSETAGSGSRAPGPVALTVRLEINLPAQADQETYDRLFRSLRQNFIDG